MSGYERRTVLKLAQGSRGLGDYVQTNVACAGHTQDV